VSDAVVCKCGDELQPDDGAICGACLQPEIAEAEERGRRAGIEERDELLRAALQSVEWVLPPQGETPAYCLSCGGAQPHHVPGCLIAAALAPRDSGKEDRK
jgi:hypothetical protein